jgi:hypothetical protein
MEERIMKKAIGGLLMWLALILFVCDCDIMTLLIVSKIVGGIVGYVGYIMLLKNHSSEELNEQV